MENLDAKIVKTYCGMCPWSCGIKVHVEKGTVVKVEGDPDHPYNKGRLCPKAFGAIELVNHPDRIRHPLKKENGAWKRISWDEALDTISDKLNKIKQEYGARSAAFIPGCLLLEGISIGPARRFWDIYGSANCFTVESMCFRARLMAQLVTFGNLFSHNPLGSQCIVLWGTNPHASNPMAVPRIKDAVKKGARLIVIDPRKIKFAETADIYAQPRPGTDCALGLAMLNVIISEGLYDKHFVEKWTVGFDRLEAHVKNFPPEEMAKITLVPAETIRELARLYATAGPATIIQGGNTLDQNAAGFQTERTIAILAAVTGNIDVAGGQITASFPPMNEIRLPEMLKERPLGVDRYPVFHDAMPLTMGEGQSMALHDALLTGEPYPIKGLIVSASNILLTWPNSNKLKHALEKLDFMVVMDQFMTETAEMADIVLPAATFLEGDELSVVYWVSYGEQYFSLRNKVVEVDECWTDWKFWFELARKMGYGDYFPWNDMAEMIDYLLEPAGISFKGLKERPNVVPYGVREYQKFKKGDLFMTPSKKVELYSKTLEDLGYDPMPVHLEPLESPLNSLELSNDYPLVLTTGARLLAFHQSKYHNLPSLARINPEPFAEVHPETARKYHVESDEMIVVETKRGNIEIKIRTTSNILPQVVSIPHGWQDANVNLLTDEMPADPVTGYPGLKSCLCSIRKK